MDSVQTGTRALALATSLALMLSGCSGARETHDPPATVPATPEATTPAPDRPPPTATPAPVQLALQRPEPLCPPATALDIAPPAGDVRYELIDPYLSDTALERLGRYNVWCTYKPVDAGEPGEDMVLAEHVVITSETRLYRAWEESRWREVYPALPLESDNLDQWRVALASSRDKGVWWAGCGPREPCPEGREPTVQTRAWQTQFEGHVGNLEFYVHIIYIAERLPADAESRTVEIFRSLVLATMESYERVG
jgi:hypothetical protein